MGRDFVEMKTGMTLYIDFARLVPGLLNGEGQISITLRHKKGRSARLEIIADEKVYIELKPKMV
jgi:hypothetical protein